MRGIVLLDPSWRQRSGSRHFADLCLCPTVARLDGTRTLESNCDVVSSFPWLLGMRSAPDARCSWRFAVSPLWKVRTGALTSEHASEQLLACRPTSRLSPSNQAQDDVQNRDLRPSGHCWYASQAPLHTNSVPQIHRMTRQTFHRCPG